MNWPGCKQRGFMKDTFGICSAVLVLVLAGCNLGGRGIAGGGDSTSDLYLNIELAKMKLELCVLPESIPAITLPDNTLPVVDGLSATMAAELKYFIRDIGDAETCDAMFLVLNSGVAPTECAEPGQTCSGSVAKKCWATADKNVQTSFDCATINLDCLDGSCVLGTCETSKCDDTTLVTCDEMNIRHEYRCGSLGLACGFGDNALQCTGTGTQCSTTAISPYCTGSILTWCLGGKLAALDCATITDTRRTCQQAWLDNNASITASDILTLWLDKVCAPAYAECEEGVSTCDDTYVLFCRDGIYEGFECLDYGFESCRKPGADYTEASCVGLAVQPAGK